MGFERPNILIIMSDQHSRSACGCYGHPLVRTPNIDRLAAEGVRLDAAYCPAPLCVPSRMSFMTARTPSANRVWTNEHSLDPETPTWAHYLGLAGYRTALIGRMHFVGADQLHGFHDRPIGEPGAAPRGVRLRSARPNAPYPRMAYAQNRQAASIAGYGRTVVQWNAELVRDTACDWLRAAGRGTQPFAAVVGFYPPHSPYIAPQDLFDYYYPRVDVPEVEDSRPETVRRLRRYRGFADPPLSDDQIRAARVAYFALCEYTDSLVGDVLDALDESERRNDTLVIYCSDHGDMAGAHGIFGKSCYYEDAVGVPLIMRLPGAIAEGSRYEPPCSLMDLGPTMVEAAGGEAMREVDGRSLWKSVVAGGRGAQTADEAVGDGETEVFAELLNMQYANVDHPSRMIRRGGYKLWLYADDESLPPALFDLQNDPRETRDLAGDPAYAEVVEALVKRAHAAWHPAANQQVARRLGSDAEVLGAWGQVSQPEAPYLLSLPDMQEAVHLFGPLEEAE